MKTTAQYVSRWHRVDDHHSTGHGRHECAAGPNDRNDHDTRPRIVEADHDIVLKHRFFPLQSLDEVPSPV
jgi:hypothetical protein